MTLFDSGPEAGPPVTLGAGAALLPGFALSREEEILSSLAALIEASPLRRMETPGGHRMSVGMTNCGDLGWVSSRAGYRYAGADPETGRAWPPMPGVFFALAGAAAEQAGFEGFRPNACLVNCYEPGAKMGLHQDRDEGDFTRPIVSVSLGLSASFLFGGGRRSDPVRRVPLHHGDVVVWGGPSRLNLHGIAPVKRGQHPRLGSVRFNLTLRFVTARASSTGAST